MVSLIVYSIMTRISYKLNTNDAGLSYQYF